MSEILVSGFTFIKNGISLGYPFVESIKSIEPLCDEIVINVGFEDHELTQNDGTWELLTQTFTHPKYVFLKSYWDPALRKNGEILAQQTNIALQACRGKICQYIQGDEVIHEEDLPVIHDGMMQLLKRNDIDGLIFNYIHFYGNVDVYKFTKNIYKREIRTIKNNKKIISWLDAQGFRYEDKNKLPAKQISARILHYGWARQEMVMQKKVVAMDKLYHENVDPNAQFEYKHIWGLKRFKGTHPACMNDWISKHRNSVDYLKLKPSYKLRNLKLAICDLIEKHTGYRLFEYKNFILRK